jgi:hypothetical protein
MRTLRSNGNVSAATSAAAAPAPGVAAVAAETNPIEPESSDDDWSPAFLRSIGTQFATVLGLPLAGHNNGFVDMLPLIDKTVHGVKITKNSFYRHCGPAEKDAAVAAGFNVNEFGEGRPDNEKHWLRVEAVFFLLERARSTRLFYFTSQHAARPVSILPIDAC